MSYTGAEVDSLPERLLMGSGPSPVPTEILEALATPTIGHLDPAFIALTDRTNEKLRYAFGTENRGTFPVSGTGSAGMEAMVANFLEPGDRIVVAICGVFGARIADAARRLGVETRVISRPMGGAVNPEEIVAAIDSRTAAVVLVHGETSTGIAQPLGQVANAIHEVGGLLMADCVTSLGGHELRVDEWGIDVAFSGTQKCLNVPPGLSPFTYNSAAENKLRSRKTPVPSWCFDLVATMAYWAGKKRLYHHTPPVNLIYALNASLTALRNEGLEQRWERHSRSQAALIRGLEVLGVDEWGDTSHRLSPLTPVAVPDGAEDAVIRERLLTGHGIEISAGLGDVAGRIWRIGTMGEGARPEPVERTLVALADALDRPESLKAEAVQAASSVWNADKQPVAATSIYN